MYVHVYYMCVHSAIITHKRSLRVHLVTYAYFRERLAEIIREENQTGYKVIEKSVTIITYLLTLCLTYCLTYSLALRSVFYKPDLD